MHPGIHKSKIGPHGRRPAALGDDPQKPGGIDDGRPAEMSHRAPPEDLFAKRSGRPDERHVTGPAQFAEDPLEGPVQKRRGRDDGHAAGPEDVPALFHRRIALDDGKDHARCLDPGNDRPEESHHGDPLAVTEPHERDRVLFLCRRRGMDQGVGRSKPQGSLHGVSAGNEMREQRVCTLSANRGAGDFDLRAGKLLQACSQSDAAARQDHSDVTASDPDVLDRAAPALSEQTAMQPTGDFIRLEHRL